MSDPIHDLPANPGLIPLPDGGLVKLGRIRPKARPQALRFASFFDPDMMVTPPPAVVDYAAKAMASIAHMYKNDQFGDCVIASVGHVHGVWTGNDTGTPIIATDAEIVSAYHTICGVGDNGCNISEVLDYRKATGIKLGGTVHKIDGYVAVDWANKLEVQVALYLFGALTLGINLPSAWANNQTTWDVTNTQIVGGHDVPVVGYSESGATIATWGGTRLITWPAFTSHKWLEECYAVLAPDWYGNDQLAPCGVDVAGLKSALAALGNGTIPPITPPTVITDWGTA